MPTYYKPVLDRRDPDYDPEAEHLSQEEISDRKAEHELEKWKEKQYENNQ